MSQVEQVKVFSSYYVVAAFDLLAGELRTAQEIANLDSHCNTSIDQSFQTQATKMRFLCLHGHGTSSLVSAFDGRSPSNYSDSVFLDSRNSGWYVNYLCASSKQTFEHTVLLSHPQEQKKKTSG